MELKKEISRKIPLKTIRNYAIVIVSITLAFIFLRPAITTYSAAIAEEKTSEQFNEINNELLAAQISLEENIGFKDDLFEENKALNNQLLTCQENYLNAKNNLELFKKDLYNLEDQNTQQWKREKEDLEQECEEEKQDIEEGYSGLNDQLDELNEEIDSLETDLSNLQSDFNTFAKNIANSICCKEKIDNWEIRFYDVVNNNIVCLEEGDKEIACPFG